MEFFNLYLNLFELSFHDYTGNIKVNCYIKLTFYLAIITIF